MCEMLVTVLEFSVGKFKRKKNLPSTLDDLCALDTSPSCR